LDQQQEALSKIKALNFTLNKKQ